jgi:hypothetical protein
MKVQRRFLIGIYAFTSCVAGGWTRAADSAAMQRPADGPATHNMVVLREKTTYLSHLPMFQEPDKGPMPHRYQVILEVTFTNQKEYVKDRQEQQAKLYTLTPEDFVLPQLVSTDLTRQPLRSFKANAIFRGHLERPDRKPILFDEKLSVNRVVHFREFNGSAKPPSELEYFFFGKGQELFLAHRITKAPDFDQILAVEVSGHTFTDEELAKGVPVRFPGRANAVGVRLKEKQRARGELQIGNPPASNEIQVEVRAELYLEEGELRLPPNFGTTAEEKLAGFP